MPMPPIHQWSFTQIFIAVIVFAACCAVVWVALTQLGIVIPHWVVLIFWICVVAVVAVLAIKFIASLF